MRYSLPKTPSSPVDQWASGLDTRAGAGGGGSDPPLVKGEPPLNSDTAKRLFPASKVQRPKNVAPKKSTKILFGDFFWPKKAVENAQKLGPGR